MVVKNSGNKVIPDFIEINGHRLEIELVDNVKDAPEKAVLYSACGPYEALEKFASSGATLPAKLTGLVQGKVTENSGVLWYVTVS